MAEQEQAAAAPARSGGGIGARVVNGLGIFVLTLAAVVVGGFINAALHPPQELVVGPDGQLTLKPREAAAGAAGGRPTGPALYFAFEPPIVTNFEHEGAVRFLQVNIEVMARDPAAITAVQQNAPLIRNNLTFLMSSLSHEEVMSREGRESLRSRSLEEVKAILAREAGDKVLIEDLLFTSFVVQ